LVSANAVSELNVCESTNQIARCCKADYDAKNEPQPCSSHLVEVVITAPSFVID